MTYCPASVHVLHHQANCYFPRIWLVISKKAKEATVNALGSAGDSQLINQSSCVLSHMYLHATGTIQLS